MNLEDEIKNGGVRWIVRLTSISMKLRVHCVG